MVHSKSSIATRNVFLSVEILLPGAWIGIIANNFSSLLHPVCSVREHKGRLTLMVGAFHQTEPSLFDRDSSPRVHPHQLFTVFWKVGSGQKGEWLHALHASERDVMSLPCPYLSLFEAIYVVCFFDRSHGSFYFSRY